MNELNLYKKQLSNDQRGETEINVLDIDNLSLSIDGQSVEDDLDLSASIECVVKWFRPEEGYGFLKSRTLNREIFIHSSALEPVGINTMSPGDVVVCSIVEGMRGPQVDVIHSYVPAKSFSTHYYLGYIKWFNLKSDFGFITGIAESEHKDIFLPGKKVRSNGLDTARLIPNQPVEFTFKKDLHDNYVVARLRLCD